MKDLIRLSGVLVILMLYDLSFAQFSLDYFLTKAENNSPALNEYRNLREINQLQQRLYRAQVIGSQLIPRRKRSDMI